MTEPGRVLSWRCSCGEAGVGEDTYEVHVYGHPSPWSVEFDRVPPPARVIEYVVPKEDEQDWEDRLRPPTPPVRPPS